MSSVEHSFHVPPFPSFPSTERYVPLGSQDEALQRVQRAIEAWEAISLVIGPPGVGKSLLCQMLLRHFAGRREVVVFGDAMLDNPMMFQRHLLTRLNRAQGVHSPPLAPGEDPQLALVERLARSTSEFPGMLLLVDEAQALTPEVLETIRIITNTMSEGRPRVSAVLLGGPKLEETLALPSLEALVQRVATRCYMHPLNSDESIQYVQSVIEACGSKAADAISTDAIHAIHKACSGTPRLINQMMTAAIDCAASANQSVIDNKIVDRAWAVLQQLPSPMVDEPELIKPVYESNVEFGALDEGEHGKASFDKASFEEGDLEETVEMSLTDQPDDAHNRRWNDSEMNDIEINEPVNQDGQGCDDISECQNDVCQSESQCQKSASAATLYDDTQFGSMSIDCQTYDNDYESVSDVAGPSLVAELNSELDQSHCDELPTPSAEQLFGQFDDEEEVCASADALVASSNSGGSRFGDLDDDCHGDLEASLHEEVLSLRGAAASPLAIASIDQTQEDDNLDHRGVDMEEPDYDMAAMQNRTAMNAAAPVLWMEEGDDAACCHDDRDLLVIEDDIQVDGAELHHEVVPAPAGRPVSVDFQSMLAKMRSPQS